MTTPLTDLIESIKEAADITSDVFLRDAVTAITALIKERDALAHVASRNGKLLEDEIVRAAGYLHKLAAAEAALAKAVADEREAVAWLQENPVFGKELVFDAHLTAGDKANGWTETPLYAHPAPAAPAGEIEALEAALAKAEVVEVDGVTYSVPSPVLDRWKELNRTERDKREAAEAALAKAVDAEGKLVKRPVAFRVKAPESTGWSWLYYADEQKAAESANNLGVDYDGLYVRDGTPLVFATPETESRDD